jgi:hypothetical protein
LSQVTSIMACMACMPPLMWTAPISWVQTMTGQMLRPSLVMGLMRHHRHLPLYRPMEWLLAMRAVQPRREATLLQLCLQPWTLLLPSTH